MGDDSHTTYCSRMRMAPGFWVGCSFRLPRQEVMVEDELLTTTLDPGADAAADLSECVAAQNPAVVIATAFSKRRDGL